MEASTQSQLLPVRLPRTQTLERRIEALRPLGERYVVSHFGGQLAAQDAEDVVADVIIRLYERGDGVARRNLNALFFTSCRNKAIDLLRSRGRRPEAPLEAAADRPSDERDLAERVEMDEGAAVLRDALARMRPRYREAVQLKYGVGLSVPELARLKGISVSAAKKLVFRGVHQAEARLSEVMKGEHCEEARELIDRGVFARCASKIGSDQDRDLLTRHLSHCGWCKSYVAKLNGLHEIAGTTLLAGGATTEALTDNTGHLGRAADWLSGLADAPAAAAEKVRLTAFKLTGTANPGAADAGVGGALAGTGQKIAAICATGATATCLATGVVGPGVVPGSAAAGESPVGASELAPARTEAIPPAEPASPQAPDPAPATASAEPEPTPAQQVTGQVGFERTAPSAAPGSSGSEFGGPAGGGTAGGSSGGSPGGFGFEK